MSTHDQPRTPAGTPTGGEFAAHVRADSVVGLDSVRTVELPAGELTVLARPLTVEEAAEKVDDNGYVTGIVEVLADDYFGADIGYDPFYDGLTDRLISGIEPVGVSATIRGVSADGRSLYVEVSTDFAEWESGQYS